MKINPIDYFNFNHVKDAEKILLSLDNIVKIDNNKYSVITNKEDEKNANVIFENGVFRSIKENHLFKKDEIITPFMILQRYLFKNNFKSALNYVLSFDEFSNVKENFIRVGTDYFKIINKKSRDNILYKTLKKWSRQAIIDDYGKDYITFIPDYNDFTIYPDNINYRQTIGNDYNLYSEFPHKPLKYNKKDEEKLIKWSLILLRHIFGEQFELGVKYMKILYEYPKQILPILVLVSEERGTGKTTFLNWLKIIFGENMVIINPENIGSNFNGSYATKNIAAIEESVFESVNAIEKLKNLSTQKTILINTKYVQEYSAPSFIKIIITANNENKFAKVDDPEIRYWVRKIPVIDKEKYNNQFIEKDLKNEIPYFLTYLLNSKKIDFSKSRMVFTAKEISTKELKHVKEQSLPVVQKDIIIKLEEYCMNNNYRKTLEFTASDIKSYWYKNDKTSISYIRTILKEYMKLEMSKPKKYTPLYGNEMDKKTGRVFTYLNQYYDDSNQIEEIELPY